MKIILIVPHVGQAQSGKYVRSWQMEPLGIATLAGLTPSDVEIVFFDERVEKINFEEKADLVGITTETYTAKRAYEISIEFHRRGIPVILGGYHPTLAPDEAMQYADSVLVGFAEGIWDRVLDDVQRGVLQRQYARDFEQPLTFAMPRRDIFLGKPYFGISCVETGRGCPMSCDFCVIAVFTNSTFVRRPIDQVIKDINEIKSKYIFFVDDNIAGDVPSAKKLFKALIPLKIKWISQVSMNVAKDEELLSLMAQSGCFGVLIGFESLKRETLRLMNKVMNIKAGDISSVIRKFHSYRINIYGAFVFGYDSESTEDFCRTVQMAKENKLFIAAFNHLIPHPGTPLYQKLKKSRRLLYEKWWLSPNFRFGDIPFKPRQMSAEELRNACIAARRSFYNIGSIIKRVSNFRATCSSLKMFLIYWSINLLQRREVNQRIRIPLGDTPVEPKPIFHEEVVNV